MAQSNQKRERELLTDNRIRGYVCGAGRDQDFFWDTDTRTLAVRVTPGGRKTYIFQSRMDGRTVRMTIGTTDNWTPVNARKRAREIQREIDQGRDPRQVQIERKAADDSKRQQNKAMQQQALVAWSAYIDARTLHWSARHRAEHITMARAGGEPITRGRRAGAAATRKPGILRPLLEKPLPEITREEVVAWLEVEAAARPTRARLALSLLNAFLRWCADNPAYRNLANPDACARLKKDLPKPGVRSDCLQREQLAIWFEAVGKIGNPVISAYLQALLLTGARRTELASLRWSDVDMQWGSITIRDKVEGERSIPLTPYVKRLLEGLKPSPVTALPAATAPSPSPWVFASPTSKSGHIQEPRIAHNKALQAAGLPHMTIHGLRRSFGTLSEWVEAPAGVVAQIQGHKPSAIAEKHYRPRPLDLLRMWHTKIEAWILEQAGIEQPAEQVARLKAATVR